MGYLIKSDVISALEEDMGNAMMCYEGKEGKDIVAFCYESMGRIIEELPQYWPDNMIEDTGITPDQTRELKERDTARAPEPAPLGMGGMVCPSCGNKALPWDRFCPECGQRFWEDE